MVHVHVLYSALTIRMNEYFLFFLYWDLAYRSDNLNMDFLIIVYAESETFGAFGRVF
jgi:hypothetical protein